MPVLTFRTPFLLLRPRRLSRVEQSKLVDVSPYGIIMPFMMALRVATPNLHLANNQDMSR
jgi:hypothetical protein